MAALAPTIRTLHVNPGWAKLPLFNRKQWARLRFGDVVENLNEAVSGSAKARIEGFIELEHQ